MRKISVVLLTAAFAVGLTGCSAPDSGSGATTISFAHWGNNEENATMEAMVAAFEAEHPDIDIEAEWIQADYEQRLQTTIAGGSQATVAQIGNTMLAAFANAFRPVEVDPDLYYSANTARSMQFDGEYLAVPFVAKPKVMAVNAAVFEDAGVEPPTADRALTIDEFDELAQQVTSGTAPDKTYGSARLWFNGWLVAEGGAFYNDDATACTLDSPEALETTEDLIAAQSPDGYAPTQLDAEGQDMFDWLGIGRLAMQPDFGPWDIAKLVALDDPAIDLVPVPGDGSLLEFNGLGISASASDEEAEAAQTFVDFMSTAPAAQDLLTTSESSLGVPIIEESLAAFLDAAPDKNLQAFVDALDQSTIDPSVANDNQIRTAFDDVIYSDTALGAGDEDPATVLADFNVECQSILDSE
ncbi:extracellular solute-binding protein [Promicromonospora sp. Populi]|uniref:extracellular solute-binding protein n=1 Tax=Promicromonospora sp. Populi TaxID=3239420 RepID=UPI0034E25AE7